MALVALLSKGGNAKGIGVALVLIGKLNDSVLLPGGSQGLCVRNIVVLLCQLLPAGNSGSCLFFGLVFLYHQRQLGIIEIDCLTLAVFIGLGIAVDPRSVIQTVCREDILVVQQNEIILRRRSDQCTAYRCCAICIDQRVAFQILVLYATAGTQHRRQCKDEHKQSIPFHGFAPFVRFCHSRSAPSRARAAFSAFASS